MVDDQPILFCKACGKDRHVTQQTNGTFECILRHIIECLDCGAPYTGNCGPGSVFVPAVSHVDGA